MTELATLTCAHCGKDKPKALYPAHERVAKRPMCPACTAAKNRNRKVVFQPVDFGYTFNAWREKF